MNWREEDMKAAIEAKEIGWLKASRSFNRLKDEVEAKKAKISAKAKAKEDKKEKDKKKTKENNCKKKVIAKKGSSRRIINIRDELDPKLLEPDDASDDWSDMDDCTLSNLRDHQGLSDPDESANQITLEAEKYFAVYYDVCWYLGRIISIAEDTCVVKFLKQNLETFDWPPHEDKQVIKKVFYGSIQLKGSGPFTVTRGDYIEIKKAYSLMKKKYLSL
ncbi:hypothetical protein FQR65_LT04753 [Abscondita terminalis]|nr:hypothetical protein FQR65_LT04753 [Abscondita terminalis]